MFNKFSREKSASFIFSLLLHILVFLALLKFFNMEFKKKEPEIIVDFEEPPTQIQEIDKPETEVKPIEQERESEKLKEVKPLKVITSVLKDSLQKKNKNLSNPEVRIGDLAVGNTSNSNTIQLSFNQSSLISKKEENIINKALYWLSQKQQADGSWGVYGWLTGLALMSFFSYHPLIPRYRETINNGVKWIKDYFNNDTAFIHGKGYAYIINLFALIEAYLFTKNKHLEKIIIRELERVVNQSNSIGLYCYFFVKNAKLMPNNKNLTINNLIGKYRNMIYKTEQNRLAWSVEDSNDVMRLTNQDAKDDPSDISLSTWVYTVLTKAKKLNLPKNLNRKLNSLFQRATQSIRKTYYSLNGIQSFAYSVDSKFNVITYSVGSTTSLKYAGILTLWQLNNQLLKPFLSKEYFEVFMKYAFRDSEDLFNLTVKRRELLHGYTYSTYYLSYFIAQSDIKKWEKWKTKLIVNLLDRVQKPNKKSAFWNTTRDEIGFSGVRNLTSKIMATSLNILSLTAGFRFSPEGEKLFIIPKKQKFPIFARGFKITPL